MTLADAPTAAPAHQDLLKQLRAFLAGASAGGSRGANPRLAQTALHLLVHLPAARDAVFEYYGGVLEGVVARHSGQEPAVTEEEEELIEELQKVLAGFVERRPEAWAPIVSAWALDILGRMTSKYSSKISGPPSRYHSPSSAWSYSHEYTLVTKVGITNLATLKI